MKLSSPERTIELTQSSPYERHADGRPRVPDDILQRMQKVTTEEAYEGIGDFRNQFDGDWTILHPERTMVGRALTCRFVPKRPDLHDLVEAEGKANGNTGFHNSWVIDMLQPGDVLVVELFGKIELGTFIGDKLGTGIATRTGGTGLVVDGSIRDYQRVVKLNMNVFTRGLHPSGIGEVTLAEINGPVRIGQATVLPGDVVLGTPTGLMFIPPIHALQVVEKSEVVRRRDYFGKMRIREGIYPSGEMDSAFTEAMEADFEAWQSSVDMDSLDL
mgnify:CR=1 FL=1